MIEWLGKPVAIRCDNGPEFISHEFTAWVKKEGIRIDYIQPGNPQQNAYIERANRTIRYGWVVSIFSIHWMRYKAMQLNGFGFTIMKDHIRPTEANRH